MSVAVIHEISQPLSTLAIEARHLHGITADADSEIAESAALIDRKAATLSDLVRRLRRYGGRSVDEPTPLPVTALIDAEAPSGDRRNRMVANFNRGFRSFQQTYRTCTPAANVAVRRYLDEGSRISREITARYTN